MAMDVAEFTIRLEADTAAASRKIQQEVKNTKSALKGLQDASLKVGGERASPTVLAGPPKLSQLDREKRRIRDREEKKQVRIQALREEGFHAEADKLAGIAPNTPLSQLIGKGFNAAGLDLGYSKLVELGAVAGTVAAGIFGIQTAFDFVKFSVENVTSAIFDLTSAVVKMTAETLVFTQDMRLAFGTLIDNEALGAEVFDKIRRQAVDLGLDVDNTVDSFRKLLAAQFSIGQADELIKASADLQAVGASATDVKHALLAISQIKMKGKLQAEELTRQLANAGVSTELVYTALQKRLGLSLDAKGRAQVLKLQKQGKISSDDAIPAIIDAIKAKAHESEVGQVASARASSTLGGMWRQTTGTFKNFFIDVAEEIDTPVTEAMQKVFGTFQRFMSSPILDELRGRLAGVFISAANFISTQWPNIEPVIFGVAARITEALRQVSFYIDNNGDTIVQKITLIASAAWMLGTVMFRVTEVVYKLVDSLMEVALFFDKHPTITKLLAGAAGVAMLPFAAANPLLPLLPSAGAGLVGDIGGVPSGPVEKRGIPNEFSTAAASTGGLADLLENIDNRKLGLGGNKDNWRGIGTLQQNIHVEALDLSDPDSAGEKLGNVIRRHVQQMMEDSE